MQTKQIFKRLKYLWKISKNAETIKFQSLVSENSQTCVILCQKYYPVSENSKNKYINRDSFSDITSGTKELWEKYGIIFSQKDCLEKN